MPLLAALLLVQAAPVRAGIDPYAEAAALLKEMRAAKTVEVRHVDGETILARQSFAMAPAKTGDGKPTGTKPTATKPNGAADLLAALQGDFLKARNDSLPMCGFHADLAIVTKGTRTLKTELCFGCGVVQVEIPGPPMRRTLSWLMNDRAAMKRAVRAIYPGIKLGAGE